jgi:glycine cleavage system T protein
MTELRTTPLHLLETGRGARFAVCHGWEIAEDYGDSMREYEAVRARAGALDASYTGRLAVSGRDRVKYLHNMLSNDIKALGPGKGCYATLLTHQGRMESDLYVYALEEELLLETPPAASERVLATLNKFIIADQVTVEDRAHSTALLSLQGPEACAAMERTLSIGLEELAELDHRSIERAGGSWLVARRDRTGCGGYDLWLPAGDAVEVWREWTEVANIQPVGHRALDWLRTEAGIPWYGADMDEMTLPMEMGLDRAISMTKGCYRGQEIVARVVHRGHLQRRLAGIAVDAAEPPERGAEIRSGGVAVGQVTSATFSPRLGRPLALAIVKDEHRNPGTRLEVAAADGNVPGAVVVLPLP